MIKLKTNKEIDLIRESSKILKQAHKIIGENIKPGITTSDLNKIVEEFIISQGAKPSFKGYQGFPASICASPNEQVVHGIPNDKPLKEGDILSVDIGVYKNGYHSDAARTYPVGEVSTDLKNLIAAAKQAFYEGLKDIKTGNTIGDISNNIQKYIEKKGYGLVKVLVGHGIGSNLHEEPAVPNFGNRSMGEKIQEGMVLAIEPMINLGTGDVEFKSDGWTCVTKDGKPSAHYENTVAFTNKGVEILTG